MDTKVFESDSYQRVFQYLKCYSCGGNLDIFNSEGVNGSPVECLERLLRLVKFYITVGIFNNDS